MTIPTLTTERLTLQGPSQSWDDAFAVFAQSERAMWFTGLGNSAANSEFLSRCSGHWSQKGYGPFYLFERGTEQPIGMFSIWHPEGRETPGLMWFLFEGAEGQGYIFEAAKASAIWHIENAEVREATSHVDARNTRSIATAERLKGQFVCTFDKPSGPHNRYLHRIEEMAA